jgi:hypothetical protein
MMMPIATINKLEPLVISARTEQTYRALDVKEIKIVRSGEQYVLRATFLPHDPDSEESLTSHQLTWEVRDLVTYLSDKPGALTKVIDFVKAIAAQAQADPLADRPQPDLPLEL